MKTMFKLNRNTLRAKLVGAKISAYALGNPKGLLSALLPEAWRISVLSFGKVKSLTVRVRMFNNFMQSVFRTFRYHGSTFTIQWLKGNSVALQRFIAGSPYSSLREYNNALPLPRLYQGLPGVIPQGDRKLIRRGNTSVIRFWLTLFNVYRILDAPLSPKLNTITDPFKGDLDMVNEFSEFVRIEMWKILPGVKPSDIKTSASYIFKTQSSGPNSYNSIYGYFSDLCWWAQSEEDYAIFKEYCLKSKSYVLFKKFDDGITLLFNLLTAGARIPVKGSFSYDSSVDGEAALNTHPKVHGVKKVGQQGYVNPASLNTPLRGGQLALKVEPAGKVRVFAIADIWTQSALAPLHDSIFRILRKLPNDGTFDQDAAFKRCQEKSVIANEANSIDLSSATDLLPIIAQVPVLDTLTKVEGFGKAWADLLVKRGWYLPTTYAKDERFEDTKLPFGEFLYYGCGQPMGALSSWGMLALTHHLLVQFAAKRVHARGLAPWYDNYEVLGDDIVIFDSIVTAEYQVIMNALGVPTNPYKSIPSPKRPVCEFAKRTSIGYQDVSGFSWKEFLQGNNLPGKINLALRLGERLLINQVSLKAILVRFGSDMRAQLKVGAAHGLIGILGSLLGKLEDKSLIPALSLLVGPDLLEGEEYNPKLVNIPINQAIQVILHLMKGDFITFKPEDFISRYKERRSFVRSEIAPFASQTAYLTAYGLIKGVVSHYDDKIEVLCHMLIDCSRVTDRVLKAQIRSVAEDILLRDTDPQDVLNEWTERIVAIREEPTLDVALRWLADAEAYARSFEIKFGTPKGEIPTDNKLALMASRAGEKVPRYWDELPEFRGYPELGLHNRDWLRSALKNQS